MGAEDNKITIPSFFDNISEPDVGSKDIVSLKNTFQTPLSHYSAQSSSQRSDQSSLEENGGVTEDTEDVEYGGDATHFPSSIKFILGNEIGERYSFFSMKSILNNYLINFMGYQSKTAESIGHGFNASAYFFTLLGAYVADGRLGKFKTILYFSILYCIGAAIFAITAIPGVTGSGPGNRSPWGLILGLSGIAIGTGGIKPVVSAFCGDQFGPHQKKLLANLFQVFYWCVNVGAFFSSILSPILRTNVGYWCAFLVPAGILLISIVIFIGGNKNYIKRKPQGSIFSSLVKIIAVGVSESTKKHLNPNTYNDTYYQDCWVDRAKLKHDPIKVDQVKMVLKVLLVFTPLPFFWALYDQTGTRWTTQGNTMNRRIGSITLDTEIIGAINPLLILIFVPIFEYALYRPLQRKNINFSPLRKMGTGMFLSVIAFLVAAALQLVIDNSSPNSVHIAYQIPQNLILTWGEILLSITGLEFAYANSPRSMKSVVMAGWLLTVSIGNLFDVFVISSIKASEFVLYIIFAAVMFVFICIFVIIAYKFKPLSEDLMNALNGQNPNNNQDGTESVETSTVDTSTIDNLSINDEVYSDTSSIPAHYSPKSKRQIEENFTNDPDIPSSSATSRRPTTDNNSVDLEKHETDNSNSLNNSTKIRNRSLKNSNESVISLKNFFNDTEDK
ncbi:hypothetical protein DICPUDRAFT_98288 [Dictyostelium purpureum]|uniref:Major facilitator superfamily (MFS) profile domain-containing protein n=1 Tax=Dictyostelium purpureum TaxID=5786 RepID=F0ZP81_DICPU|nr:uncharacterized protein DICPUDRAFT_98288 [Dictyostelium purpureum]EGC34259.1 hypothetical protein DICPUDRAFT_98288 [Dictyostelium purpureum]|eukprot:XP_003289228.1 hypothetical protein DICPUDRAFT_98288 [Dictyostelium purpureum]